LPVKAVLSAVFIGFFIVSGSILSPAQTPAAPPVTTAQSPEIHELQVIEDKWASALNQRDQYALELVLSPLFVNIASNGDVTTRNQQIVATINPEDKTAAIEFRVITVRMLGDVAVANGTYAYTHKAGNGEGVEKGVFTHVFQRQHGNWVCMNAQRTSLREDPAGKTKATKIARISSSQA
jgi:hypothetical protein